MKKAQIVAVLTEANSLSGSCLESLSKTVDWLEIRGGMLWDRPASWFRQHFGGRIIFSLDQEGVSSKLSDCERMRLLARAAQEYDLIDIDFESQEVLRIAGVVPESRRLITSRNAPEAKEQWLKHFSHVAEMKGRFYRLVTPGPSSLNALGPLCGLASLNRDDVVAYGEGPAGIWSRVLALYCGAPMIFGYADESEIGEPTIRRLCREFGIPFCPDIDSLGCIVGNRVTDSPSPEIHNRFYRELGEKSLFVSLNVASFTEFWRRLPSGQELGLAGFTLRGFTVAAPYKEVAASYGGKTATLARQANASNLIYLNRGVWTADTSDWVGLLFNLRSRRIPIVGQKVAVVGCGGSGRVMAYGLSSAGADVTLFNRSCSRGLHAQRLLGLKWVPVSEFLARDFTMILNATSVGADGEDWFLPLTGLLRSTIVVDLVYRTPSTKLVEECRVCGNRVIDGYDILREQVAWQFEKMTGRSNPRRRNRYEQTERRQRECKTLGTY